jgi:hypothetical protein
VGELHGDEDLVTMNYHACEVRNGSLADVEADILNRPLSANSRSRSERQTCALAQGKLIAKTPLGVPQIEPEAVVLADEARMVSSATHDVTTEDSANYTA